MRNLIVKISHWFNWGTTMNKADILLKQLWRHYEEFINIPNLKEDYPHMKDYLAKKRLDELMTYIWGLEDQLFNELGRDQDKFDELIKIPLNELIKVLELGS